MCPKEIAVLGKQVIHSYPYFPHFTEINEEKFVEHGKGWAKNLADMDKSPKTDDYRLTRLWTPDDDEAGRLSEVFGFRRCATVEEALDGAAGAMVMDEQVDSRADLIEQCVDAGVATFADKVVSIDSRRTEAIIEKAKSKGVEIRTWSQLYFLPFLKPVREAPTGGVALLDFSLGNDILIMYGIHVISMLQGAFASPVVSYRPLEDRERIGGMALLEDGTIVYLYTGANMPFRGRLYYNADKEEIIVNQNDDPACFTTAAKAIIDLWDGRDVPGPGYREMIEASRLIEAMAQGGRDGREVKIAD